MSINDLTRLNKESLITSSIEAIELNSLAMFKILNNHTAELEVDFSMANRHIGDFFGLLLELDRPYETLYIETLINGYESSLSYDGKKTKIILIENDFLSKIIALRPKITSIPQIKK